MTEQSTKYPAGLPEVNGRLLTVDEWLRDPEVLESSVVAAMPPLLSDVLFRQDTTNAPAVLYTEAELAELYPQSGDVEYVDPESEVPLVDIGDRTRRVATARTTGFAYEILREAVEDNDLDAMRMKNAAGINALSRQDDARVLHAFYEKVPTVNSVGYWDTGRNWQRDLLTAQGEIEARELGYEQFTPTVIVNPVAFSALQLNTDYQDRAPREDTNLNPMFRNQLLGLGGYNWAKNRRIKQDEAIVCIPGLVGRNILRRGILAETDYRPSQRRTTVTVTKRSMPVIDNPGAAYVIKGILPPTV